MKTIVLFGDSNTWGYVPGSMGERFPRDVRWPARLASALGDTAEVIAEGLGGRMATIEHPASEARATLTKRPTDQATMSGSLRRATSFVPR